MAVPLVPALATTIGPGGVQPGHDRPLPTPLPALKPYDFRIESPHRSPVPRDVDTIHFKLVDLKIVGAVTIPAEHFLPLYEGLIGKQVTLANIFDIADAIERAYRDAGYPLIRAYVPPQRVNDGIFMIVVREGYVASVAVEGADKDTRERVHRYLTPVLESKPLKLATIERGLLLANDLPGVVATGILRASPDTPGASDLIITLTQPALQGNFDVNNRGSRYSGHWNISGELTANAIIDDADQLNVTVAGSPHALNQHLSGSIHYRHPIGDDGFMASLDAVGTIGVPGSTLRTVQVKTNSFAYGPRFVYPIERSRAETINLSGGFTMQDAVVDVFNTVKLSHDKWRVLDLAASYVSSDLLGGAFGGTFDVAQGLPVLGASHDRAFDLSRSGTGDIDFTKLVGGARYSRQIAYGFSAVLSAQGQYSFNPLVSGEQITFGGDEIGRGYDPGAITGDQGIGSSLELRYEERTHWTWMPRIQPFAFLDVARTWYINPHGHDFDPSLKTASIASVGTGVRLWFEYGVTTSLELNQTLQPVPGSDGGKTATKVSVDAAISF